MASLTFVQANSSFATATNPTQAYSSNTTGGSYLLAIIAWQGAATLNSVSDTLGNSWVQIGTNQSIVGSPAYTVAIFQVFQNKVSGGANTVTFHLSTSETVLTGVVEFTGQQITGGSPIDAIVAATGASLPDSTSITINATNEELIFIGSLNTSANVSASGYAQTTGMTGISGPFGLYVAQSVPGTYPLTTNSVAAPWAAWFLGVKSTSSVVPAGGSGSWLQFGRDFINKRGVRG